MKIESANSARAIPPNCAPRNAPALLLLLTRPSCAQHARSLSWHTVIVMVLNRLSAAVLRYPRGEHASDNEPRADSRRRRGGNRIDRRRDGLHQADKKRPASDATPHVGAHRQKHTGFFRVSSTPETRGPLPPVRTTIYVTYKFPGIAIDCNVRCE